MKRYIAFFKSLLYADLRTKQDRFYENLSTEIANNYKSSESELIEIILENYTINKRFYLVKIA